MGRRLTALLLAACILFPMFGCGRKRAAVLLDAAGAPFAEYNGTLELYDEAYSAYARYALREAAQIVAEQQGTGESDALTYLMKNEVRICTAAVPAYIAAAKAAGEALFPDGGTPFAVAVTDLSSRFSCIYASEGEISPTYAGSAIKPLSVYGPCIENGIMNWSSLQPDSPVKMIDGENGKTEWPVNGTGVYSYRDVPAAEALADSLNTVAVRWLQVFGPENAMNFLEESFALDLTRERSISALTSEEEILGNLALGYLQEGVTPCDMAGYYQIFRDGGMYTPAAAVFSLETPDWGPLYTAAPAAKRVLSEESAWIMNRMLRGVVKNGTGTAAQLENVEVVGKTGTSDSFADNWFVGVTPTATVAFWHGAAAKNSAAKGFRQFMEGAGLSGGGEFTPCEGVEQRIYCPESGLLVSDGCTSMDMGYYKSADAIGRCNIHG